MNAAVLSREFTRPASSKERGYAIANHRIQGLETVFRPIPEEPAAGPSAHHLTGDELTRNQIRVASFIGTMLRF
jgi:hypothetical protein